MMLWTRLGDAGEYNSHDDLPSVADELAEHSIFAIDGWIDGGFVVHGFFEGGNYVSLYWGDENANRIRDLAYNEQQELTGYLEPAKLLRETNQTQ